MINKQKQRVVVTGLGVVAPNGIGQQAFWHATQHGHSGISLLPATENSQPISVAGAVNNFVAQTYVERKIIQRTARMTHFAFAAIQEALYDARISLEQENPQRVGAVIANTYGGIEYILKQLNTLYTRGPRFVSAYSAIAWLQVANVGQAAIRYAIKGYCKTPVNDTVGGLDALAIAYSALQRGAADIIITGGCEALLDPFMLLILAQQGQCYVGTDTQGYRPFDERAAGLIVAEGAGICILENYEHARQREAFIYGEIVGYGQTNDANGLQDPPADGTYYARALRDAMQEGDISPAHIGYMSLDGRATTHGDLAEFNAFQQAFGQQLPHIPVSVPRTMLGHSYAAAGAIDTITALLALKHGLIPPTINCEDLHSAYQLDLVRAEARPLRSTARSILIAGRGTGGSNVALAIKKVDPEPFLS